MKEHTFEDLNTGHKESFEVSPSEEDMRLFSEITGDKNPLHLDEEYAKQQGFEGRIVFGKLVQSYLSRLAGMYLPGKYSLIVSTEVYYKLRKLIYIDKVKTENVVLQTDLHSFSSKRGNPKKLFFNIQYFSEFVPLSDIARLKNENIVAIYAEKYFPVLGKGDDFVSRFLIKPKHMELYMGWTNNTKDFSLEENKEKIANLAYLQAFNEIPTMFNNLSTEYFLKTLELANENDINIILIRYPTNKEFTDELVSHNFSIDLFDNLLFEKIDSIIEEYDYFDYHNIFFENPEYFADPSHLNEKGATELSKKFNSDLNKKINFELKPIIS